jgi:LAO/AO transport system ATPase
VPIDIWNDDIATLVSRVEQRDRAALSRLLTMAAEGRDCDIIASALNNIRKTSPPIIALTGSGGVGKSSLLGAVAKQCAERGDHVGILACDPESPFTGGALLGDRCRIADGSTEERIFIRSLATASGQQGIAPNIELMLELMRAFGFGRIFIETVGAGQGDIAVRRVADVVALVLQPQTGDELQWEKAGVLEIADIIVVNKSDLPGADRTIADVTQQLQLGAKPGTSVVKTSVARNEGIDELCRVIESVANTPQTAARTHPPT